MSRFGRSAASRTVIAVVLSVAACDGPAPKAGDVVDEVDGRARAATADALLAEIQRVSGAPAVNAAVVVDGAVVWEGAAGDPPAGTETRHRLASVSKLFTVAAALALVEQGRLDLDAPASAYVPGWVREGRAPVTLRELAAHTAGVNHYETWRADAHDESRSYPSAAEGVELFADAPLLFEPGSAHEYSSFGYVLLAAAVESAYGAPFADAVDALVLDPLGLGSTRVDLGVEPAEGDAEIFFVSDREATPASWDSESAFQGATGVQSSAADVARFVDAFLGGELVGDTLLRDVLRPASLNSGERVALDRFSVGVGWRTGLDWAGRRVAHHAGSTRGARSIALGYLDASGAVALLSNASWTSRIETTGELVAAPFLAGAFPSIETCPEGSWTVEGTFRDVAQAGSLQIRVEGDLCRGELRAGGELDGQFSLDQGEFNLVRIEARDGAHHFALAYSWGLAAVELRVVGGGVELTGDIVGWPVVLTGTPQ